MDWDKRGGKSTVGNLRDAAISQKRGREVRLRERVRRSKERSYRHSIIFWIEEAQRRRAQHGSGGWGDQESGV